jgi:hypothetical protein
MAMDKELSSFFDRVTTDIMRPYFMQQEYFYIDADLLVDFRLGALMAYIRNEADYKYVVEQIPTYLAGYDLDTAKYFPKLGLTERDLDRALTNPEYLAPLATISPRTQAMTQICTMLSMIKSENARSDTDRPLKLYINFRYPVHQSIKDEIHDEIKRADDKAIVEFTNYSSWAEPDEEFLKKMDFIGVYNIREFLKEGWPPQKLISAVPSGFGHTAIVALIQSDPAPDQDQFDLGIDNFVNVMELMCDKFSFIPKSIITKDDING